MQRYYPGRCEISNSIDDNMFQVLARLAEYEFVLEDVTELKRFLDKNCLEYCYIVFCDSLWIVDSRFERSV